jgi:hypothetical protein
MLIAIEGPDNVGKTVLANALTKKLNCPYIKSRIFTGFPGYISPETRLYTSYQFDSVLLDVAERLQTLFIVDRFILSNMVYAEYLKIRIPPDIRRWYNNFHKYSCRSILFINIQGIPFLSEPLFNHIEIEALYSKALDSSQASYINVTTNALRDRFDNVVTNLCSIINDVCAGSKISVQRLDL